MTGNPVEQRQTQWERHPVSHIAQRAEVIGTAPAKGKTTFHPAQAFQFAGGEKISVIESLVTKVTASATHAD